MFLAKISCDVIQQFVQDRPSVAFDFQVDTLEVLSRKQSEHRQGTQPSVREFSSSVYDDVISIAVCRVRNNGHLSAKIPCTRSTVSRVLSGARSVKSM